MFSRRQTLKTMSAGFGYLAFAGLACGQETENKNPLSPKSPHFAAKAKRVIFLCMGGGPSHVSRGTPGRALVPQGRRRAAGVSGAGW